MLNDVQFGHLIKILWHDGIGMSLDAKRLLPLLHAPVCKKGGRGEFLTGSHRRRRAVKIGRPRDI